MRNNSSVLEDFKDSMTEFKARNFVNIISPRHIFPSCTTAMRWLRVFKLSLFVIFTHISQLEQNCKAAGSWAGGGRAKG